MSKPNAVPKDDCRQFLTSLGTFESHAIIMLLCAPTEVLVAWRDGHDFVAACESAGLSGDAIAQADSLRGAIEQHGAKPKFLAVAATLEQLAYGCVEPHPDPMTTRLIISKIQELDHPDHP